MSTVTKRQITITRNACPRSTPFFALTKTRGVPITSTMIPVPENDITKAIALIISAIVNRMFDVLNETARLKYITMLTAKNWEKSEGSLNIAFDRHTILPPTLIALVQL